MVLKTLAFTACVNGMCKRALSKVPLAGPRDEDMIFQNCGLMFDIFYTFTVTLVYIVTLSLFCYFVLSAQACIK